MVSLILLVEDGIGTPGAAANIAVCRKDRYTRPVNCVVYYTIVFIV